jgi:DNA-directed RNA polymerase
MIHDSYGVPACDAPVMARALRESAAEMFSHDLLEAFRQEIQSQLPAGVVIPAPPEGGDLDPVCVLESPYFFA